MKSEKEVLHAAALLGFPLVAKVEGPLHKSDIGGVILNIVSEAQLLEAFQQLLQLPGATGVLLQQQLSGIELFAGVKAEAPFGHQVICGLGGIYVEVFHDIAAGLAPVGRQEALNMIRHLKSYPLLKGARGRLGIREEDFADLLLRISALVKAAPEIAEMDINPLIGTPHSLTAVDARIRIGK